MKLLWASLVFLIVSGQLDSIVAKKRKCGFPGTPAYGYVKPDNNAYSVGDVVSYTCRVGYILLGAPISKCAEDGTWSEEVPICDDSMTTLGVAFSTPTVPGHPAEMAIDRDKDTCSYLKPKKPRWWRIDLGEEHRVLSVAVTMIPDKNVKFTVFVIKTEGTSASYKRCAAFTGKFGSQTVVLSCAEGKGIEGQRVHIEDHLQTEGFFEICEVEVQVEKASGYDCGRPSRNLYSTNYEPENELVEYECMKGYELQGNLFRSCMNTGEWSGKPPVCEPIYCDDMDPLENGEIELSHGNSGPPLEGAVVIYKCDDGYKLEGPFTRNCLKDGSWSGKSPQCKAIRCPIPEGKGLGGVYRLVNKTNSMGSMAMLRCKGGKREGDNPYIVCTEDGEWTKPEVRCIIPARAAYEREDGPRIVNQGAIIFGMVVAAIMIVVVLVAMYLYGKRRIDRKPDLPSRLFQPQVPPPRPPPRSSRMGFKNALMGLMGRDSVDSQGERKTHSLPRESPCPEDGIGWKTQSLPSKTPGEGWNQIPSSSPEDKDAVVEVEVVPHNYSDVDKRKPMYDTLPEENEDATPEDVVLNMEEKGNTGSPSSEPRSSSDYAAVDYEKKRQSRLLKEQDSVDSSSGSPLPPEDVVKKETPALKKEVSPSETEESESEEDSQAEVKPDSGDKKAKEEENLKAKEEEERKAKEEEERKAKEEEERKAKEEEERKAKEEEEKKAQEEEKKKAEVPRRRRVKEEPPAPVIERPVLRRVRKF